MTSRAKVSCIIIAGNEAENIGGCLESVTWCDEIIVVDSYSTDETARIAKGYTEKVFERKWEGYASQKRYAMGLAKHEWVLSLDADERISERLRQEIEAVLGKADIAEDGFYIPRLNFFVGRKIRHCKWYPDYQFRLFRRTAASIPEQAVHEGFQVSGKTARLTQDMIHLTAKSFRQFANKQHVYGELAAQEKFRTKKTHRISPFSAGLHALWGFIRCYVLWLGFLDGLGGFYVSVILAYNRWTLYQTLRRLQQQASAKT
jgi:glycosyltransferase involved in cell wall biosynthesis